MELSVYEINGMLVGQSTNDRVLPFRYLPREIVQTAKTHLGKTDDADKVLRYILNSFYVYRECVNRDFFAPHYEVDNEYEWPKPVEFSWSDIETVISGGEFLHGKIPREEKGIIIETQLRDKTEVRIINPETGKIKRYFRENISRDVDKTLKYNIESLSKIRILFSEFWQIASLKHYANPFYYLLDNFLNGKKTKEDTRNCLINRLNDLETSFMDPKIFNRKDICHV
jgi:hypothetical protein